MASRNGGGVIFICQYRTNSGTVLTKKEGVNVLTYAHDLWEVAAYSHGVLTVSEAISVGVPAVEVRKLAYRGTLRSYGNGVYVHHGVPLTRFTQFAIAVALAGKGGFLWGDAVFSLLELGDFNPRSIRVATRRRVRRKLPQWMQLTDRVDIVETDITEYCNLPSTSVNEALTDVFPQLPNEKWLALVHECYRKDFVTAKELKAKEVLYERGRSSQKHCST